MARVPKVKSDDQKRDALLKRLLETPPKPHTTKAVKVKKTSKKSDGGG